MKKSLIFNIVNILLYILVVVGILFVVTFEGLIMDRMLKFMTFDFDSFRIIFYLITILILIMFVQLIRIFNTVRKDTPFVRSNIISLKVIAVILVVMGIIFMASQAITLSLLRIIAAICFVCAGLCAYVFSQLFKSAVYIKEENDFTV